MRTVSSDEMRTVSSDGDSTGSIIKMRTRVSSDADSNWVDN